MSCLQPLSKLVLVEGSLPQKLLFFGSGTALVFSIYYLIFMPVI